MATRLPPLPTISEVIRMYKLQSMKQLSQNFLLDMNMTRKIVKAAGNIENGYVVEIGPGPGGITRAILEQNVKGLAVVEKDRRFIPSLQLLGDAGGGKMVIYHGDILRFDMNNVFPDDIRNKWEDPPPNLHIMGNLPFNISSPLIIQLLQSISERKGPWSHGRVKLTLTFQAEVAHRIVAPPNDKERCRLSFMCQHLCKVHTNFVIPGSAFVPPPKVNVGVVTFEPLIEPITTQPFKLVEKVCRHVFHFKRKKVRRGVETLFPPDMPELTGKMFDLTEINPEITPIQLTNHEISHLCSVFSHICNEYPYIYNYDYRDPKMRKVIKQARELETQKIEQRLLLGTDVKTDSVIANQDQT